MSRAFLALASSIDQLDDLVVLLVTIFVLFVGTILMIGVLVVRAGHAPRPRAGLAILAAYLWAGVLTAIVGLVPPIGKHDGLMFGTLVSGAIAFWIGLDRYWRRRE